MVIDITGVLVDGVGARAPWVPVDTRQPLEIPAGDGFTIRLRAVTQAGVPVILATGDTIVMTARDAITRPGQQWFQFTAAAALSRGPGHYDLVGDSAATRYLGGRRGVYDITVRRVSNATTHLVAPSALYVTGTATPDPGA